MDFYFKQIDFKDGMITANNQYFNSKSLISRGASKLTNVLINLDGSISRRPGTIQLDSIIDSQSYILSMHYNKNAYIIEINKDYIKVITENGVVKNYKSISLWDNPKLCNIIFWQNDLLIFHSQVNPKIVSFDKHLNIFISDYSFFKDISGVIQQPYVKLRPELPEVYLNINLSIKVARSRNFTLTCKESIFEELEVGMHIKISGRNFKITEKTSSKKLLLLEEGEIGQILRLKTKNWYVQAFNSKFGYPTIACFYQGRFILSGSNKFPNQIWFSDIGNISSFTDNVLNDAASVRIQLFLTSEQSTINHIIVQQELLVMTDDGIMIIKGDPFTSQKYQIYKINSHVAGSLKPIQIGNSIIITGKDNKNLFSLQYDNSILSYQIVEVSKNISNKLSAITSMIYIQKWNSLFLSSIDNTVWSLTYNYDSKITAWSQLIINNITPERFFNAGDNLYFSCYNNQIDKDNIYRFDEESCLDNTIKFSTSGVLSRVIRSKGFRNNEYVYLTGKKATNNKTINIVLGRFTLKQVINKLSSLPSKSFQDLMIGYNYKIECSALPIGSNGLKNSSYVKQLLVNQITIKTNNSGQFSVINADGTYQNVGNRYWIQIENYILFPHYSNEETYNLLTNSSIFHNSIPWKIEQTKPLPLSIFGLLCKLS